MEKWLFMDQKFFRGNGIFFSPVRSNGFYLHDRDGHEVLDFSNNFGSISIGHLPLTIEKKIISQIHHGFLSQSGRFYNEGLNRLSDKLCRMAGFVKEEKGYGNLITTGDVLFYNSVTDANECAVKLARKRYNILCDRVYNEVISFKNSNHGTSITMLSASKNNKNSIFFSPLSNGFKLAEMNNIKSVENLICEHTCAIIVETIQYNNGIVACDFEFLKALKELCEKHEIALILDETRCGCGRSGTFFAYEKYDIKPDIVTIANGLANGLPLSACIVNNEILKFLDVDDDVFSFNGNSLLCNVANSVIEEIVDKEILQNVDEIGKLFTIYLEKITKDHDDAISSISNVGLAINVKLRDDINHNKFANILLSNGLACEVVSDNNILFFPPLNVDVGDIKKAIEIIDISLDEISIIERY